MALFRDEARGRRVLALLGRVEAGREAGYVSRVTLAELGYLLQRRNPVAARTALGSLLAHGLEPFPCEPVWEEAAGLKARHADLSLADAFAAATARALAAELVVAGDAALLRACPSEGIALRRA